MQYLFIPYDLASLAKEKGFDELCFAKFFIPEIESNRFRYNTQGSPQNYNNGSYGRFISAPLYQQLIDWFREKHELFITIKEDYDIFKSKWYYEYNFNYIITKFSKREKPSRNYKNYYEALNKAIEEAFKLI